MTDRFTSDSILLLREMIRIPSPSFGETEVCRIIEERTSCWGLNPERLGNNLIFKHLKGKEGDPVLAMVAHIDTVPAARSYTRDPYDPGCSEDVVYGLGSNDDGGSVVAMLASFRHIVEAGEKLNLLLVLSCEEERSGPGGAGLIFGKEGPFAEGLIPAPDAVIVGEPTGMKAATSERGLLVIDAVAHGVSGHAARGEGVNAIYIAMEDMERLRNFRFDRHSEMMGDVRLNITQIQAGTAHNVIPDSCSYVIDIRPTDMYGNSEVLQSLQSVCQSTLTARKLDNKSSATRIDGRIAATLRRTGIECFSSPTTSDWIRIDYDAVKMGPGDSSRSHKADEYILVSEISEAVGKYIEFIRTYCYGDTLE